MLCPMLHAWLCMCVSVEGRITLKNRHMPTHPSLSPFSSQVRLRLRRRAHPRWRSINKHRGRGRGTREALLRPIPSRDPADRAAVRVFLSLCVVSPCVSSVRLCVCLSVHTHPHPRPLKPQNTHTHKTAPESTAPSPVNNLPPLPPPQAQAAAPKTWCWSVTWCRPKCGG